MIARLLDRIAAWADNRANETYGEWFTRVTIFMYWLAIFLGYFVGIACGLITTGALRI